MTKPKNPTFGKPTKAAPTKDKVFDLSTWSGRERITPWTNPYWVELDPGMALGYRKGIRKGTWYARTESPRHMTVLGRADDVVGKEQTIADGIKVFTYKQAREAARDWCNRQLGTPGDEKVIPVGQYTLKDVLEYYLKDLESRKDGDLSAARSRIRKTISEIGHIRLSELKARHLKDWMNRLASAPPQVRSKKGDEPRSLESFDANKSEHLRRRKSSANRALGDVKAALNLVFREENQWIASDQAWSGVQAFGNTTKARGKALTMEEQAKFLNSASPELRPLAYVALLTGQRFGPLRLLKVKDFDPIAMAVCVERDKTGGPFRYAPLIEEALVVLWSICKGRDPEEPMLLKANGTPWNSGDQDRPIKQGREEADLDICLYGLRHTCITTWLLAGIAPALVAEAVNTSLAMIQKHYKHLTPDGMRSHLNAKAPKLGQHPETEAILREIEALRKGRNENKLDLEFDLASLHPSSYVGKVKGGRELPPEPAPRPTKEELATMLKEIPATRIAAKYGVSDKTVEKWCRKWNLAKPGRGFWAKFQAGNP